MGIDVDRIADRVATFVGRAADESAGPMFAFMRRHRPVVQAGDVTVLALRADVEEVLGDPRRFTVGLYGPKMEAITGPFMLGVDDTPRHGHDRAAMDRAVRRQDLPDVATMTLDLARGRIERARGAGRLDVVAELCEPVVEHVVSRWFAPTGPDPMTHVQWARDVFHELFINVADLAEPRDRAHAAAAAWRPFLDDLVAGRERDLEAGREVPDDVLTRLLRLQQEDEPNLHDVTIRHNLLGMVTGWIPTVCNALPRAVDELLGREDELRRVQDAARQGDLDTVAGFVFEASRFAPQNFALLRLVAEDTVIAAGTERETKLRRGTTVVCGTLSAMHDERAVEAPGEFRAARPTSDGLLFGHGLHTCYGQQIVRHQLPALAAALFEGPTVSRAGRMEFDGPFPSRLEVALGP